MKKRKVGRPPEAGIRRDALFGLRMTKNEMARVKSAMGISNDTAASLFRAIILDATDALLEFEKTGDRVLLEKKSARLLIDRVKA
jgi:hypothetical protein